MSKWRAATLLCGLSVVGMFFLSGVVGARTQQTYFEQMKGALGRACLQQAGLGVPNDDPDLFRAACSFISSTLQQLHPGDGDSEVFDALVESFGAEVPGLSALTACDVCVQSVTDFESYLATNGTADEIGDALALACSKKFTKKAQINQCLQNVAAANVPELIDFALANLPPQTACQQLTLCP